MFWSKTSKNTELLRSALYWMLKVDLYWIKTTCIFYNLVKLL